MNHTPKVLILGSRYDLSCDYVVARLIELGAGYLRLNTEDFLGWRITLHPLEKFLSCEIEGHNFSLTATSLHSIWFRRAVYLREYGNQALTPEEQISRVQWAAFIRNLMIFDQCKWVNDPVCTYRAEHKALQLAAANKVGFRVPDTVFTNTVTALGKFRRETVAIKGIDTVLARDAQHEIFAFTSLIPGEELDDSSLTTIPVIVQEALTDKLDLRVTVVEKQVFAVSITRNGCKIVGDWRSDKTDVIFTPYDLPPDIKRRCIDLTAELGLHFGAIDLVLQSNDFYFLEINPTGEWAWLTNNERLPIDKAIAEALVG